MPSMIVAPGDLLRDTTLEPDPDLPGRYHGSIPEAWKVVYAFGGVTLVLFMLLQISSQIVRCLFQS